MRFSASMINRWMACPLQAHFHDTVDRPEKMNAKTVFGSIVHDALEFYNRTGDHLGAVSRFEKNWARPGTPIDTWPRQTTYGSLFAKGREIITSYDAVHKWETRDIVAAEHSFHVPFGDHTISGIVDLIEVRKTAQGQKALTIVDYKTSSRTPTYVNLALNIQFSVYEYSSHQPEFWIGSDDYPGLVNGAELFEEFRTMERRGIWHNLWQNKETYVGERDEADFLRMYRCMEQIALAIDREVFVPSISGDSCIWCPYTDICPSVAPVRDKLLDAKPF